jgi:hypothetical protein
MVTLQTSSPDRECGLNAQREGDVHLRLFGCGVRRGLRRIRYPGAVAAGRPQGRPGVRREVLTTKLTSTDTTERTPCFASRPVVSLVELASGPYLTWFDGTAG